MTWLRELCSDNDTKLLSTTRVAVLLSTVTLCFSTLWLTVAAFWKVELVPALTVFGGALATMAGGSYITNRITGKTNEPQKPA